jgi:hypothetical protein
MNRFYVSAFSNVLFLGFIASCSHGKSELWVLDNLTEIGGHEAMILGNPRVIRTLSGQALAFDGQGDAVVLDTNPLSGARAFTVEVVFRPDPSGHREQRFLHMQASEDRRVLIETRLNDRDEWFLDTFIKCGQSERTLQSKETLHPLGKWYHVALVYDGREMRHFVDGIQEMAGAVDYTPMAGGQTSIGCRLNRVFWFKGAVSIVRVTHTALQPRAFLRLKE